MQLEGRVAVITGASRGIGREVARTLAREGARVVLSARSEDALAETRELVERDGGEAAVVPCDVSDPGSVEALAQATTERFGRADVLVANSGAEGPTAPLWEVSPEDWSQTIAVNLTGVFLSCRAFLPGMIERGSGNVIVTGSLLGKRPQPGRSPYAAGKLGLVGLVRTLAAEAGPHGVRVNLVSPGMVEGDRIERVLANMAQSQDASVEQVREQLLASTPLRKIVPPQEVAEAVVWLASDASGSTTGEDLNLSAGMVMY